MNSILKNVFKTIFNSVFDKLILTFEKKEKKLLELTVVFNAYADLTLQCLLLIGMSTILCYFDVIC